MSSGTSLGPSSLADVDNWLRKVYAELPVQQQRKVLDMFTGGVELTTDYSGSGQAHWHA